MVTKQDVTQLARSAIRTGNMDLYEHFLGEKSDQDLEEWNNFPYDHRVNEETSAHYRKGLKDLKKALSARYHELLGGIYFPRVMLGLKELSKIEESLIASP